MFESVLKSHLVRYPKMQIQDVYKLIHQAALGNGHAVINLDVARAWLERELMEMGVGNVEPMIDPISTDGQMARVHLRPFIAQGGDPEALLTAFIRTAKEYRGGIQTLKKYWGIAVSMENYSSIEMDNFIQSMQAKNYPAVHHSSEYKSFYRPAYRVIWKKYL